MTTATTTPNATFDEKVLAKAQKEAQKRLEKVKANIAKYPHAVVDTLTFDEQAQKYKVQIRCTKTGQIGRWVYTSDLHQVTMSEPAQAEDRKLKQAAKRAEEKKVRQAIRDQQAAAKATPATPAAPVQEEPQAE
jgi:hypothetical protein